MNYELLLHRALELYGLQALDTHLLHHSDKRVYRRRKGCFFRRDMVS